MIKIYIVHINISNNNIIITVTNINGKTKYWCSSGKKGFNGSRKLTIYSAQLVARDIRLYLDTNNIKYIYIYIKGNNIVRESIIRELVSGYYNILLLNELTPIIYNGCRQSKARRI